MATTHQHCSTNFLLERKYIGEGKYFFRMIVKGLNEEDVWQEPKPENRDFTIKSILSKKPFAGNLSATVYKEYDSVEGIMKDHTFDTATTEWKPLLNISAAKHPEYGF
jgi:hypothetical protein